MAVAVSSHFKEDQPETPDVESPEKGAEKRSAPGGNRTRDLWFIRPALYLLSYRSFCCLSSPNDADQCRFDDSPYDCLRVDHFCG